VLAIGNPGDAMLFSVTRESSAPLEGFRRGPGNVDSDRCSINPATARPAPHTRGEVIGINTLKLVKKNANGIGFALSSSDLLEVLRRFYPNVAGASHSCYACATQSVLTETSNSPQPSTPASPPPPDGVGTVSIPPILTAQKSSLTIIPRTRQRL